MTREPGLGRDKITPMAGSSRSLVSRRGSLRIGVSADMLVFDQTQPVRRAALSVQVRMSQHELAARAAVNSAGP